MTSFNYTNSNTNTQGSQTFTSGPSTTKAPNSFSLLHSNNNNYVPGFCEDYGSGADITTTQSNYQDKLSQDGIPLSCSEAESQNSLFTTDSGSFQYTYQGTCPSYWSRKLTTTSNGGASKSTSQQMHWLNGGYFYGMKQFRNYIEEETGTIHFTTAVKYDVIGEQYTNVSYGINYIPEFFINNEFKILTTNLFDIEKNVFQPYYHAPSMFNIGDSFSAINNLHRLDQINVNSLRPRITYYNDSKLYKSIFKEEFSSINNCGYTICPESFTPENSFIPDDIAVMLSNGNFTYYPLTNEKIQKLFHDRKTFTLSKSGGFETFIYDFVVPTKEVYNNNYSYIGSVENTSFNSYFINNSTETPFSFITTSVTLTDSTLKPYNNHKFVCRILADSDNPRILIPLDTKQTVINEYSEYEDAPTEDSQYGYNMLNGILQYMKSTYSIIPLTTTLYNFTLVSSGKITLDKTTKLIEDGAVITSFSITNNGLEIILNKSSKLQELFDSQGSRKQYLLMVKASAPLVGYSSNTRTNISAYSNDTETNTFDFSPMSEISPTLEATLFDYNSSKFSTPDYSSIQIPDGEVIKEVPLRGSEYQDNQTNSHPIIRYIRKPNGKFYIQILAGAYPYYHAPVHYPVVQEYHERQGNTGLNAVEKSLEKICSKSADWYNHVATTKWMCYVKHTEFGSDPSEYIQTETSKGLPAINPTKSNSNRYVGRTITGDINSIVVASPRTGSGVGGTLLRGEIGIDLNIADAADLGDAVAE